MATATVPYGLSIRNDASELVIDSDAQGIYCLGKGVLQGSVVQATGSATGTSPGRRTGFSVYRFFTTQPIAVAIDLPINRRVAVTSVLLVPGVGWDVYCHCGDTADSEDFDTEYSVDVWAYGFPTLAPTGYGLTLYNAAGVLTWDLSQANPLFPIGFVEGTLGSYTIPSLTRPVALGSPTSFQATNDNDGAINRWRFHARRGAWKRTSSTALTDTLYATQTYRYFNTSPNSNEGDIYMSSGFILEGSILP